MSYSGTEQIESIEPSLSMSDKPWRRRRSSNNRKFLKKCIHRSERQRKRLDVTCEPHYNKYHGYEY